MVSSFQLEGRRLYFMAQDFTGFAPAREEAFPLGPLPGERAAAALCAFGRIFEKAPVGPETPCALLGLVPERVPDAETFQDGIEIFRHRHAEAFASGPVPRVLRAIAARLWQENAAAAATETEPNEELEKDRQEPAQEKADWTPAAVAARLESMLFHAGRMLRRARWFALICESTLAWRPASKNEGRRHLAVFEKGRLRAARYLAPGGQIPAPPGCRKPVGLRRGEIDLTAYDTLRVLTTELRRLLAESRDPVLRLSGKAVLGPAQLRRALFWF